jgi:hypothetical protein
LLQALKSLASVARRGCEKVDFRKVVGTLRVP